MMGLLSETTQNLLVFASSAVIALISIYAALTVTQHVMAGEKRRIAPAIGTGLAVVAVVISAASAALDFASSLSIDWRTLFASMRQFVSANEFVIGLMTAVVVSYINSYFFVRVTRANKVSSAVDDPPTAT